MNDEQICYFSTKFQLSNFDYLEIVFEGVSLSLLYTTENTLSQLVPSDYCDHLAHSFLKDSKPTPFYFKYTRKEFNILAYGCT